MWAACSPVAEASHAAFKPMEYKVFVEPLRNLDLFFQTITTWCILKHPLCWDVPGLHLSSRIESEPSGLNLDELRFGCHPKNFKYYQTSSFVYHSLRTLAPRLASELPGSNLTMQASV